MASRRLHLVVDPDLGPALWVREQTRPGRSRASEDLAGLREQAPAPLAHALSAAPAQLRHRVRLFGPGSGSVRRRSEERRVGKECGCWTWASQWKSRGWLL